MAFNGKLTAMKLLLLVLTLNIAFVSPYDITCSEKWCPLDRSRCRGMDSECKCDKNGVISCQNSSQRFEMNFDEVKGILTLNGRCDEKFKVERVLGLWSAPLSSFKIQKAVVQVDYKDKNRDGVGTAVFDMNSFPVMNIITLDLVNRCAGNVVGNVSSVFPRIEHLKILLRNLTEVPKNLRWIGTLITMDLSKNEIKVIDKDDFEGLPRLKTMELSRNQLTTLPDGFLRDNSKISYIKLGYNKLTSLPSDFLTNKSFKFGKIELHFNELETLPADFLHGVNGKIHVLALKGNKFRSFPPDFFKHSEIDVLYLWNNFLTEIPNAIAAKTLFLMGNQISTLKLPLSDVIPGTEQLILTDNCIKNVTWRRNSVKVKKKMKFECLNCCLESIPVKLAMEAKFINISFNNITKLELDEVKDVYTEENGIVHWNLTYNRISIVDSEIYEFVQQKGISDLFAGDVTFELRGNPLICDCNLYELLKDRRILGPMSKVFDLYLWECRLPNTDSRPYLPDLDENKLLCNVTKNCPANCSCLESRANKNFLVNCSGTGLSEFPTKFPEKLNYTLRLDLDNNDIRNLPPQTWPFWSKIEKLDLSRNKLESLENLALTPTLRTISLQNNLLARLEPQIFDIFRQNIVRTVTLSKNPWRCSCDMKELRDIDLNSVSKFLDRQDTTCFLDDKTHNFYDVDEFCSQQVDTNLTATIVLPTLAAFVIIISILSILFFRYKLEIKYFLFSKGWCLSFVTEEDVDADKLFDAFVSYSSEDGEWVRDVLVAGLEEEQPVYKLCLHERDWPGGEFIADQIVRSVEASRRTIIVLTDSFLSSSWSQIEFNVAYHKGFEDGIRRLIVVVPNGMPNLDKAREDLRAFLVTTTYLEANKPHFWRKLRCSMPRLKQSV